MGITMSRVRLTGDTCDLYFAHVKVNLLLYTCSLDPFEDGILPDTPLVCMHRYCRSFTDNEEECKRQGSPTPSAREAWKRRRKKKEMRSLERPDDRKLRDDRHSTAPGRPTSTRRPTRSRQGQPTEATTAGRPASTGRPTHPRPRSPSTVSCAGADRMAPASVLALQW